MSPIEPAQPKPACIVTYDSKKPASSERTIQGALNAIQDGQTQTRNTQNGRQYSITNEQGNYHLVAYQHPNSENKILDAYIKPQEGSNFTKFEFAGDLINPNNPDQKRSDCDVLYRVIGLEFMPDWYKATPVPKP